MKTGYIQVYTGDGKGKTTAALGLCLRAVGAGLRVYIAQFLKKGAYNELAALEAFSDKVKVEQFGTGRFVRDAPDSGDRMAARKGLEAAVHAAKSGDFDIIVLDEGCVAAAKGLIAVEALLDLAVNRPATVELVITGRGADPRLLETADLVTEMKPVKHYFQQGVQARQGIEK